jgi:Ca2+-binding EF-hand superfamily protein
MIVRSHECVRTGFDKPYQEPEYADLLCTVFSASNYYGSGNTAAYMIFRKDIPKDIPYTRVSGTDIVYTVHYFITETGADDDDDSKTSVGSISNTLGQTLYDLVLSHKAILLNEFKVLDKEGTGKVSKLQWAEVLQNVSKLQLQWLTLFPVLVSEDLVGKDNVTGNLYVEYEKFLENFSATFDFESVSNHNLLENKINHATGSNTSDQSNSPVALLVNNGNDASSYSGYALEYVQDSPDEHSDLDHSSVTDPRIGGAVVEALYSQHRLLESVFRFFDTNGSGTISLDEFKQGCEIINSTLPEESKLKNVDRLLAIMDVSQKGEVDINEFFEMFRLSDAHMNISAMLSTPKAPPASPGSSSANLNRSHSSARKAITVISPSSTNLT